MPDPPVPGPEEEKIIINAGIAASVLEETCSLVYRRTEAGHGFPNATELVKMANEIEEMCFKFSRAVLEGVGFNGPWPKSMK